MSDEDLFMMIWGFCLTVVMPIVITKLVLDYRVKRGELPKQRSPYFEPKPIEKQQIVPELPEANSMHISELEGIIQKAVAQSVMPLHEEMGQLRTQLEDLKNPPKKSV